MSNHVTRAALGLALLASVAAAQEPRAAPAGPAEEERAETVPLEAALAEDALLRGMVEELERSVANLKGASEEPLYYLAYRVHDGRSFDLSASYGALVETELRDPLAGRRRLLDVTVRVGSPELDNTHKVRGEWSFGGFNRSEWLPLGDDVGAMRVALWRATEDAYRDAVRQLIRVKANLAVKVEEEDQSADFAAAEPHVHLGARRIDAIDLEEWKERCKRLSAIFKDHPLVLSSHVGVSGSTGTMYLVDNEGARIREPRRYLRVALGGAVKASDGMDLELYETVEATTLAQLPTEEQLAAKVRELIARLEALREAPVVDPWSGPAIIRNRAAGVFFHEIFGHRAEGHRLRDEEEGQTFKKKVGESILPGFLSVVDDPTRRRYGDTYLNGFYRFDEEGVPAEPVHLVERGVLRNFLMCRTPIEGFPRSNGHGRAQPGQAPVSRQGNLIVESAETVPYEELRRRLVEEVKRRGKPYGLVFEDIAGGFTFTQRFMPQSFKVIPLVVYKVHPDGRPDELVRGVDLVGTPLQSLEKILAAADDFAVFNGYCGAESGWVPVSAVAPSVLIAEMEVEKKEKGQERLPILPPPLHPELEWPPGGPPSPAPGEREGTDLGPRAPGTETAREEVR